MYLFTYVFSVFFSYDNNFLHLCCVHFNTFPAGTQGILCFHTISYLPGYEISCAYNF